VVDSRETLGCNVSDTIAVRERVGPALGEAHRRVRRCRCNHGATCIRGGLFKIELFWVARRVMW